MEAEKVVQLAGPTQRGYPEEADVSLRKEVTFYSQRRSGISSRSWSRERGQPAHLLTPQVGLSASHTFVLSEPSPPRRPGATDKSPATGDMEAQPAGV